MQTRHQDRSAYFEETATSCRNYYLPYIEQHTSLKFGRNCRVMEVGCGFGGILSIFAAKGATVTGIDIHKPSIETAKTLFAERGLKGTFICSDIFDYSDTQPYDLIILDPPAFTKARRTVDNAMRGYKEINYRAMKLLPRGGYLATASCSHFATEELFIKMLKAAAKDAHRQLRQIEVKQQAPDHPILWGVPETNYLKFFLFQVI